MNTYDKIEAFCIGVLTAAIFYAVIMSSGCATAMTADELEVRNIIADRNWAHCAAAIHRHGWITYSTHAHPRYRRHTYIDVQEDLRLNQCRVILGDHWLET